MSSAVSRQDCTPWERLSAELDAWSSASQTATLWWRDDDAVAAGKKLDKLIELTASTGLLLAVIPSRAQVSLASRLNNCQDVYVAQHGYSHTNHAPRGQGKGAWELGLHREQACVMAELATGRQRLESLFGKLFLPVIVPPWNRLAAELLQPIADDMYRGISVFGAHDSSVDSCGLIVANAHCDPIRWKGGAAFAGESKTLAALVAHLEARRIGRADANEHTGFLTHHIDLDQQAWDFCERLVDVIDSHPAARWVSASAVFAA
jgi:hypothetical protein